LESLDGYSPSKYGSKTLMGGYQTFRDFLKQNFSPLLRADGFKGSGTTFRRIKGEAIHIIDIQGSKWGGECCINLAVHFLFLPTTIGQPVDDYKKLRHSECEFRIRLHGPGESDHWWPYGETEAESESSAENLIDTYQRFGGTYFEKFEPFPDALEKITAAEMDAGDISKLPPTQSTLVRLALTMARIMNHLKRFEKCRQFAEVGLRHLGNASGLRAELEQLRNAT